MAKAAKSGESKQGLIITLVFFIILSIGLGVGTYIGFNEQGALEDKAKEAATKQKGAELARDWNRFQNVLYKAYAGLPMTADDTEALQTLRTQWPSKLGKGEKNEEEVGKLIKSLDEDPNLGWDATKGVPKANYKGLVQRLTDELAAERDRNSKAEQNSKAALKKIGDLNETLRKEVADRVKKYDEAMAELKRNKDDKSQEFLNAVKTLETRDKELEDVNKKVAEAKEATDKMIEKLTSDKSSLEQKSNKLQEQVLKPDLLNFDQPKGKITSIDKSGKNAYVNLGSADNIKPPLTFSVLGVGPNRTANSKRKAALEIVSVVGPHLSQGRITDLTDAGGDPIVVGDLLFNPVWNPSLREHIAIIGVIDLTGDGTDSSAEFKRNLEKQNVVVDLYMDPKTLTTSGKMTFNTSYLVDGGQPEIDQTISINQGDPRFENARNALIKLNEVKEEAKRLGVQIIPARRFMALIGYPIPKTTRPPVYPITQEMISPKADDAKEAPFKEKPEAPKEEKDLPKGKNGKDKDDKGAMLPSIQGWHAFAAILVGGAFMRRKTLLRHMN